ncbi:chromate transporter [Dyadobacter sp. BE34]|uniref:Chromate transporter n=1 Tax=Dyadobacter fermentans TaxID=94254 RepID=A0ABU1QZE2_9BACT|nr:MULTISPECIES: chromate transporter [Dyadobacter]MDR6806532.1 chromate transporter [Dyadobacter fermentans]MDR7044273.1 chromate transporter [Dyadobacter sp. BE242]MDR7198584.1 chromate transporter [Dyadobacter sp. BE34]MDR7216546.1 chromate transporter [Dyadobacter sp. BE31]MDR7263928.1 chromate transporter [Dyadobacter sp. BE32]
MDSDNELSIMDISNDTRVNAYSLAALTRYFLKLGTFGFGGPVALIGYMHRDLVEQRQWITEEEYREGLALAQLAPGPLAAQLGIYLGYVHYGVWGATLTGLAFVLPSFIMVVLLGMAYQQFGGLPWMQSVFYGVGSAVIGIIGLSCYKLTIKSVSKLEASAIKSKWILWLFFTVMAVVTAITEREEVWLFIVLGLAYMVIKAPPKWLQRSSTPLSVLLLAGTGFWTVDPGKLMQLALFFTEAGAFVFGSGLAIIPFLHAGVVNEMAWLNEQQFLDSVAVAMITPGPVVITVGFIGFLVSGFAGAAVAALGVFLPCFVFTVLPAPYFKKISKNESIKAFVDGITASVVGALVGSVFVIGSRSIVDVPSAVIAVVTALALIYIKRLQEPYIILLAAVVGFCLKEYLL